MNMWQVDDTTWVARDQIKVVRRHDKYKVDIYLKDGSTVNVNSVTWSERIFDELEDSVTLPTER